MTNDRADRLAVVVAQLNDSVQGLAVRSERSEADITRSKRAIRWTAVGVVLDIVLTVVAALLFNDQRAASSRLDAQQQQITRVQRDVLCPLYDLFLASYNPRSPQAKANPAKYEASFKTIREGVVVLECHR